MTKSLTGSLRGRVNRTCQCRLNQHFTHSRAINQGRSSLFCFLMSYGTHNHSYGPNSSNFPYQQQSGMVPNFTHYNSAPPGVVHRGPSFQYSSAPPPYSSLQDLGTGGSLNTTYSGDFDVYGNVRDLSNRFHLILNRRYT